MIASTKNRLEVTHDGIRANAMVLHDAGKPALQACSLDSILESALQPDTDLAAEYAAIIRDIASRLHLRIIKEIDGSHDNGCCWFAVEIAEGGKGASGDTLTTRPHRFGSHTIRGWNPSLEAVKKEKDYILRRACRIGLGDAEYWTEKARTVADNV